MGVAWSWSQKKEKMKKKSKTDPKGSNYILILNFVQQLLASPMSHSGHDPSNQYHQNPHENTLNYCLNRQ